MTRQSIDDSVTFDLSDEELRAVQAALQTLREKLAPLLSTGITDGRPLDPVAGEQLAEVLRPLAKLSDALEDTMLVVGNRALEAALACYESFKAAAAAGDPRAAEIVAELTACHPFLSADGAAPAGDPPSSPGELH